MAEDGIHIKFNLPDFQRQLKALSDDMQNKVVRSATNAAAQVFRKAAIAAVPVLQRDVQNRVRGALRDSIYVARARDHRAGFEHYVVGYRVKGARAALANNGFPYGIALEQGWIPRGRKGLKGGKKFKALIRSRDAGRKITTFRFLQPAFDKVKEQALAAFVKKIEERILKANSDK